MEQSMENILQCRNHQHSAKDSQDDAQVLPPLGAWMLEIAAEYMPPDSLRALSG
jgi:hypothetical protein